MNTLVSHISTLRTIGMLNILIASLLPSIFIINLSVQFMLIAFLLDSLRRSRETPDDTLLLLVLDILGGGLKILVGGLKILVPNLK